MLAIRPGPCTHSYWTVWIGLIIHNGDDFVSIEHLFLGLLEGRDQVANLLKDAGVKADEIKNAFLSLRGNAKVNSQTAEESKRREYLW